MCRSMVDIQCAAAKIRRGKKIEEDREAPFIRYNLLSKRLSIGLTTVLKEHPLFVQPVVKPV